VSTAASACGGRRFAPPPNRRVGADMYRTDAARLVAEWDAVGVNSPSAGNLGQGVVSLWGRGCELAAHYVRLPASIPHTRWRSRRRPLHYKDSHIRGGLGLRTRLVLLALPMHARPQGLWPPYPDERTPRQLEPLPPPQRGAAVGVVWPEELLD